jgi:hypothetical protein
MVEEFLFFSHRKIATKSKAFVTAFLSLASIKAKELTNTKRAYKRKLSSSHLTPSPNRQDFRPFYFIVCGQIEKVGCLCFFQILRPGSRMWEAIENIDAQISPN